MNVIINGQEHPLDEGATVEDALAAAGQEGSRFGVAVALNGEVVPRGVWASTTLRLGDRVEVLIAAQGG